MHSEEELLYQIALTQIDGIGDKTARHLLTALGGAKAILKANRKALLSISGLGSKTVDAILDTK